MAAVASVSHDPSAAPQLLEVRGMRRAFGATLALAGVDLVVGRGEVVALAGENGAGKSTLVRILAGAIRPDAGTITLDGAPFAPGSPAAARRAGVVTIHQELSLVPHLSVAENIVLGAEPRRGPFLDRRSARATARAALDRAGASEIDLDARAGLLAPGGRQLVEVARALAAGCRLLVLDEPTSSLGRDDAARLLGTVDELRRDGTGIVYISHALDEIERVADRCVVLRDGAVSGSVSVKEVERSSERIVALMVGRELAGLYPRTRGAPGDVVLSTDRLGGERLPREATLQLRRGEVLGIAGLVGSGRTELLRTIFGLDPVRRGTVRVAAFSGAGSPAERWRDRVGMVSEDRAHEGLARARSIAENMLLPRLGARPAMAPHRPGAAEREAGGWVGRLGVRCRDAAQPVGELSGGNQQKVAIARLLACGADVLLLDEPTRGIDIGAKAEIYALVDALAAGAGPGGARAAVLVVSSFLPELLGMCDRIAVMARGRLGPARPAHACTEESIMREATALDGSDRAGGSAA